MNRQKGTARMIGLIVVLVFVMLTFAFGCTKRSGETWMVNSAPLPDGWPELSPIDQVEIRTYPAYRAAFVSDDEAGADDDQRVGPMFMTLFDHIKENEIAMTAPVEMGYDQSSPDAASMTSMAFLYRTPELGPAGDDGRVVVRDCPPQTYASIGVRGDYSQQRFRKALTAVNQWIEDHRDEWIATGPPRYLGYNGPFTPSFMRYGEVQVPVRSTSDEK